VNLHLNYSYHYRSGKSKLHTRRYLLFI